MYLTKQQGISDFSKWIGLFTDMQSKIQDFPWQQVLIGFGMFETSTILPVAIILEMLWVSRLCLKSPGIINTSRNYVDVHTWQLTSVNMTGVTGYSSFLC